MNTQERLDRLERLLAELADEVSTGSTGHIRTPAQNRALAVLRELRPEPETVSAPLGAGAICGKVQRKGDEDSPVCLMPLNHKEGHQYGVKPS
jgi:hypothetical protein